MTLADYYEALGRAAEEIVNAEGALRREAKEAPTVSAREETLSAADSLSSTRRRLRSLIAQRSEAQVGAPPTSTPAALRLTQDPVSIGSVSLDPVTREVRVDGELIRLAKKEYQLLRVLAADPTRVFSKDELLRDVWGFPDNGAARTTRTLDSHASRLRRKLDPEGCGMFIVNCWGVGYRLVDEIPMAVGV